LGYLGEIVRIFCIPKGKFSKYFITQSAVSSPYQYRVRDGWLRGPLPRGCGGGEPLQTAWNQRFQALRCLECRKTLIFQRLRHFGTVLVYIIYIMRSRKLPRTGGREAAETQASSEHCRKNPGESWRVLLQRVLA
jgi:hypothetical protein